MFLKQTPSTIEKNGGTFSSYIKYREAAPRRRWPSPPPIVQNTAHGSHVQGNHMAKLMQSSAITIKDQSIFIPVRLRAPSQKQKHGEDNPPLSQANETLSMDHMYKAKRDGDHRLDFLLLLFFHQGKKRRTVPKGNHMVKPMQSSAITIKDQSIFIQISLRVRSQN